MNAPSYSELIAAVDAAIDVARDKGIDTGGLESLRHSIKDEETKDSKWRAWAHSYIASVLDLVTGGAA